MKIRIRRNGHDSGFSLIEILIAVVILATGLLALTALQGRLAQASAEAKTRSRVASMLASRLEELRAGQYSNAALDVASGSGSTTTTFACSNGTPVWLCTAQTESGVSALGVSQQVARWTSAIGAGSFAVSGTAAANLAVPEFKRIILTATWTDATNGNHQLSVSSDVSPLSLTSNTIPRSPNTGDNGGKAIVRQDNPAGPGVIPIAIGGGDATAASNPRPEVIGRRNNESVVGTRFDVLTYEGLSGASVIQRRVETAVIACTCQYGAGGTNFGEIYQEAQWPAEWTGERYEVAKPGTTAPGDVLASKSGPKSGVDQSPLCTECCRDHHDAAANATKFDPVRTGTYVKYNASLVAVGTTNGTSYIDACRLIRVDGFWRTATDMYAKHFGLINTTTVAGVALKSAAPSTTAVTTYQAAVKSYLAGYTGGAASIANAADGGQVSGTVNINAPSPVDERYLHARGLYVDYLTQAARDRIIKARLAANCTSGDYTECTLPFLPFTTINNTELSYWEPRVSNVANTSTLTVATASSLVYDPLQPTRGRTNAKGSATNGSVADATAIITRSNAGVAITGGVDPDDDTVEAVDKQSFRVTASGGSGTGQSFSVKLIGLPQTSDTNTSNDPSVAWSNASGSANCNATIKANNPNQDLDPNDYACSTYGPLGIATTARIANYFREYTVSQSMTAICTGNPASMTATAGVPTFSNYAVSSAVIGGTNATSITVTNDALNTEYTVVGFAAIASGNRVDATFTLTSTLQATIASCVATRQNANKPWEFSNIVWARSWSP